MTIIQWVMVALFLWFFLNAIFWWGLMPWMRRGPGGDPILWWIWMAAKIQSRVVHHARYEGREHIPAKADMELGKGEVPGEVSGGAGKVPGGPGEVPGGLIVVANHTGAMDAFLIQSQCGFLIRWMMAQEMMVPAFDRIWARLQVLPVGRDGKDSGPLREALRLVKRGGVLGIFPEGRIVVPPREVRPFATGAGMIIAKTKAPVLLCWVSGTPDTNEMMEGLLTRSEARVVFFELLDFSGEKDPERIVEVLREKIAEASGWEINDEPIPVSDHPGFR